MNEMQLNLFPSSSMPETKVSVKSLNRDVLIKRKESILNDVDDWQSGRRATPGSPMNGNNYPLRMRCEIAALDKELAEVNRQLQEMEKIDNAST